MSRPSLYLRRRTGEILVISMCCIAVAGCIEASRPVVDARVGTDIEAPVDVADVADINRDTGGPEDIDTPRDQDGPETDGGSTECDENNECGHLGDADPCTTWECISGQCQAAPLDEDSPCDDGNQCTLNDSCKAGACQPGTGRLSCNPPSGTFGCKTGACVPDEGCVYAHLEAGTACDNGSGPTVGSCEIGGFIPPDACDGSGRCLDQLPGAPNAPGVTSLLGDWFVVYTNFANAALRSTTRAVIKVGPGNNTFSVRGLQGRGPNLLAGSNSGKVCADTTGLIEAVLVEGSLSGRHLDGQLAILSSPVTDGVALLLRKGEAGPLDVDGVYNYVQTTEIHEVAEPRTWRGQLVFEKGCLKSGLIETDPMASGSYAYAPTKTDCLTVATDVSEDAGLVTLTTHVEPVDATTASYRIFNRGMIGSGGDIVVMVKESTAPGSGNRTPDYGIIVMVRQPDAVPPAGTLLGEWAYAFNGRVGTIQRRDVGNITWSGGGVVEAGTLSAMGTSTQVGAGWFARDSDGKKMAQRMSMGAGNIFQSGFFAAGQRFIVGWQVKSSSSGTPVLLPDTPESGGLLFMLKP